VFREKGGFDVVIENPPYIRVQRLDHQVIDALMQSYQSAYKKLDLSVIFIERSLMLTNSQGIVTIISSSQWMKTDYGARLRELISRRRAIRKIIDFGSLPVFEDVSTYPAVILLSPLTHPEIDYSKVESASAFRSAQFIPPPARVIRLPPDGSKPWIFDNADLPTHLHRQQIEWIPLSQIGHFFIGALTGMDNVFVLPVAEAGGLKLERRYLFPYAYRGAEIRRYQLVMPKAVVIYPYQPSEDGSSTLLKEKDLKKAGPNIFNYLRHHEAELRQRMDSRRLYANGENWFCHLRPGRFDYIRPAKLIIKGIADRTEVGYLAEDTVFNGANCPAFVGDPSDYNLLLACLNSKVVTDHLRAVCPPKLQGYFRFNANNRNSPASRCSAGFAKGGKYD